MRNEIYINLWYWWLDNNWQFMINLFLNPELWIQVYLSYYVMDSQIYLLTADISKRLKQNQY